MRRGILLARCFQWWVLCFGNTRQRWNEVVKCNTRNRYSINCLSLFPFPSNNKKHEEIRSFLLSQKFSEWRSKLLDVSYNESEILKAKLTKTFTVLIAKVGSHLHPVPCERSQLKVRSVCCRVCAESHSMCWRWQGEVSSITETPRHWWTSAKTAVQFRPDEWSLMSNIIVTWPEWKGQRDQYNLPPSVFTFHKSCLFP